MIGRDRADGSPYNERSKPVIEEKQETTISNSQPPSEHLKLSPDYNRCGEYSAHS